MTVLVQSPATGERQRRDAITDLGLAHFQATYPGETIGEEDVFYYVYVCFIRFEWVFIRISADDFMTR